MAGLIQMTEPPIVFDNAVRLAELIGLDAPAPDPQTTIGWLRINEPEDTYWPSDAEALWAQDAGDEAARSDESWLDMGEQNGLRI